MKGLIAVIFLLSILPAPSGCGASPGKEGWMSGRGIAFHDARNPTAVAAAQWMGNSRIRGATRARGSRWALPRLRGGGDDEFQVCCWAILRFTDILFPPTVDSLSPLLLWEQHKYPALELTSCTNLTLEYLL